MDVKTDNLESMLHSRGYKLTFQRQAIFKIIQGEKERHLCSEEIFDKVKKEYPKIGLATVYRTLQLFEKLGLVHHILLDDGCMRFQLINSQEKHHHLICEICSEVIDVDKDLLQVFEQKLLSELGFTVTDQKVQFFGKCKKCTDKEKRRGG